jgi:outer membrane protein assembly factor BamB
MKRRTMVQLAAVSAFVPSGLLVTQRSASAGHLSGLTRQGAATITDTMLMGNPSHTGVQPGPGPAGEPVERWRYASPRRITSTPAIANGVLYVAGIDRTLAALDALTGSPAWQVELGAPVSSSPVVTGGLVVFGTSDAASGEGGFLLALDAASGEERWRVGFEDGADASPAFADGVIFAGVDGGSLHAISVETGEERWSHPFPGDVDSSPIVADGVVYVGSQGAPGIVAALNASTGEQRWSVEVPKPVVGPPALHGGTIYIGCTDGFLYALDAQSGAERWTFESGEFFPSEFGDAAPAIAGGVLYLGDRTGTMYGIDAETGTEVFRTKIDTAPDGLESTPAVVDGTVYVSSEDGGLYAFDAVSGAIRWRYEIGAEALTSPLVTGGLIFVGGETQDGGVLLALGDPEA